MNNFTNENEAIMFYPKYVPIIQDILRGEEVLLLSELNEIVEIYNAGYDADLSSNFGNYNSSPSLVLSILGGAGAYQLREDYPEISTPDSYDVQSIFSYSLDVVANTTGGAPYFQQGVIDFINNFPD